MNNRFVADKRITNEFVEAYTKTTYRIVGAHKHSAIKPCHWLEQRLLTGRNNRNCYKDVFGVESHRCLQNSPAMPFCNHQCVFCWRDIESGSIGNSFIVEPDEPKMLIDEMLRQQRDIISNHLPLRRYLDNYEIMIDILYYMIMNPDYHNITTLSKELNVSKIKVDRAITLLKNQHFVKLAPTIMNHYKIDKDILTCIDSREEIIRLINQELTDPDDIMQAHMEALNPNHAAISLDGEPLMYPMMSDYIAEFENRNMTNFVVTNGTFPDAIEGLDSLPSQLYVTLPAPNENLYKKLCRPMISKGWDKLKSSLQLLNSLSCRTVIRLTAIKNLNVHENFIQEYQKVIEQANPNFFEIKGFTLQAKALLIKKRLRSSEPLNYYFPDYNHLRIFADEFSKQTGYPIIYSNEASRDFLFAINWDEKKDPKIKHK
jgi:wyosine [tRNA(Phe)-imidazoG37] synthetase (radical SAM superfamily)